MHATATLDVSKRSSIFDAGNPGFREDFDETPFEFTHCFDSSHPMFQLSRIRQFIENPATRPLVYYDQGAIGIGQRWDSVPERKMTVEETFDQIDTARGWILMKHVDRDPEYNELLQSCLEEVKRLTGRKIDEEKKSQEAIIFVTSPNRVTSYHIDRECNLLMQVKGNKQISVFDRNDREVITEQELETFWSKDNNAAVYKPELQDRAYVFEMKSGTGVHIPVNSPHWLKTPDNMSISFSVSYQYKDNRRKHVYQTNYYLRKMGLKPTPLGSNQLLDRTKSALMGTALAGKKLLSDVRGKKTR